MEGIRPSASAAEFRPPPSHTPVERLNRQLARPVAAVFQVLGFPPSVQSLWITVLGILYLADGAWTHLVPGAALVYLGLVFDRAETLIAERKGRPQAWSQFFGLAIDRLSEVAILVGLGFVAGRGVTGSPIPVWSPLDGPALLAVVCAAAAVLMALRALQLHSEILLLRLHLLQTRRLPGPSLLARSARPVWSAVFGRDEMVLLVCVGLALGQPQATALALLAALSVSLVESMVLFRMRLREPEPEASRLLGPDYP